MGRWMSGWVDTGWLYGWAVRRVSRCVVGGKEGRWAHGWADTQTHTTHIHGHAHTPLAA